MLVVQQQRTILIIDDNPIDREAYRRYLLRDIEYTYTILEAELGDEGLALCQRYKPNIILLDFFLPDMDGLEFLAELKDMMQEIEIPIILLTGQGDESLAQQAIASGIQNYLVKGRTSAEDLRAAIAIAMEKTELR